MPDDSKYNGYGSRYSNLRTIMCFSCGFKYLTSDTEDAEMFVRMTHQKAEKIRRGDRDVHHLTYTMHGDWT